MPSMQHYRAFALDRSGRLSGCINLVCDGDDDARRQAGRLVSFHRIELWRLNRHVATFEAVTKQQPAPEPSLGRSSRACDQRVARVEAALPDRSPDETQVEVQ